MRLGTIQTEMGREFRAEMKTLGEVQTEMSREFREEMKALARSEAETNVQLRMELKSGQASTQFLAEIVTRHEQWIASRPAA